MKLSKKLLATLLPITAATAVAPVLSSCNKGNGYVINYGDTIDCLNEKATNYHTLDAVKASVKNKAPIETLPTISEDDLPNWTDSELAKQSMYYDLVASISILAKTKFNLTWTITKEQSATTYKIVLNVGAGDLEGVSVSYLPKSDKSINIALMKGTNVEYETKSYCFQNTTIGE